MSSWFIIPHGHEQKRYSYSFHLSERDFQLYIIVGLINETYLWLKICQECEWYNYSSNNMYFQNTASPRGVVSFPGRLWGHDNLNPGINPCNLFYVDVITYQYP